MKEVIPPNMPKPPGNSVSMHCFVDANHAGNKVTRRSQKGILIFVNKSPIIAFSKRQNTVETSRFGSEFTVLNSLTNVLVSTVFCRLMNAMIGALLTKISIPVCDQRVTLLPA